MKTERIKPPVGHTPGPWHFERCQKSDTLHSFSVLHWHGGADPACAELARLRNPYAGDAEANARLIAAAPDLLESLKLLIDRAERELTGKNDITLRECRAAIAKAEGAP